MECESLKSLEEFFFWNFLWLIKHKNDNNVYSKIIMRMRNNSLFYQNMDYKLNRLYSGCANVMNTIVDAQNIQKKIHKKIPKRNEEKKTIITKSNSTE